MPNPNPLTAGVPDLSAHMQKAQAQIMNVQSMRANFAMQVMCRLVEVGEISGELRDAEWNFQDEQIVKDAKERMEGYASMAVYGTDALLEKLGLIVRKKTE